MFSNILSKHANEVNMLCKAYSVKNLFAFGSVVSEKFDERKSDLDFLVELQQTNDPLQIGENMLNLWNGLEQTFNRPVDLVRIENVHNPILKAQIEKTKVLVYAA
ncbi:MAG: nucleotidyltransferase domain-containing protein [Chitinophagales bacterium]|nr:nucleotidyltransferase domain-containing protein [Chitinophagales bacterium]